MCLCFSSPVFWEACTMERERVFSLVLCRKEQKQREQNLSFRFGKGDMSSPIALPHEQREQVLMTPDFEQHMALHGCTTRRTGRICTDLDVFRQQWLVCPNGASYSGHTFFRFFGSTPFRKCLRTMLISTACTREGLMHFFPSETLLSSSLTFLVDQQWFHLEGNQYMRGPYQAHITNIGRTVEWYVAEWFRFTYSHTHLVAVRHGVEVAELPIPGDLDVVAFLDEGVIVLIECKSSSDVDEAHFSRFLQRTQTFRPTLAILLIDTQAPFAHARLAAFNAALHAHGYGSLHGTRGMYRGAMNSYVVNVEHSIALSLRDIMNLHGRTPSRY